MKRPKPIGWGTLQIGGWQRKSGGVQPKQLGRSEIVMWRVNENRLGRMRGTPGPVFMSRS